MDFLLYFLQTNPFVPYLGVALVLLVGYQQLAKRAKIRLPGISLDPQDLLSKVLGSRYAEARRERQASRYRGAGQYLAAGKLYEEGEQLEEAVETYEEGGEYYAAASILEKQGNHERAAELYLKAGDHKKAAQILTNAGKPANAAALFLEKGNTLEAARLFGLANAWDKAADLYLKGGYPLRAAEGFEKVGEFIKAAECYERHFMENVSYSTTYSSTAVPTADQKSALLAGRLYQKAGDLPRALQILQKGQYFKAAGEVCLGLGQFSKAAELFLRSGEPSAAAEAYDRAGDPVQAATLRGEVALKEERVPDAAAFFQQGQDYLRAAELYESVDLLAEAAAAYEAGESYAAAGNVYVRAGLKDRAAASYERAREYETAAKLYEEVGQHGKAIELFERAGFTFMSGEAAAKGGDREKAFSLLQRVAPSDEHYGAATVLLARLFLEGGKPSLAIERLQKGLAGQALSAANVDLHYWLGVALETAGRNDEALAVYRRVLSEDVTHRDVEKRAARLEAGGAGPVPALALLAAEAARPAPPPPSAPSAAAGRPSPAPPPAVAAAPANGPAAAAGRPQRFTLKEEIGRGPLGVVYRGEDRDGRNVAVRALPAELLRAPGVLGALAGDLKSAAQVSHPNIVKVLGFVELDGQRCVVSEFVAGRNFGEALRTGHKMTVQQVHGLGRVLAQVLSFVHGRGLVHGSIQPSNIMVTSGVIKVADLGLGRMAHGLTGTRTYQLGSDGFDAAGDLYALAAVLYHLLTGVHPSSQPQGVALPLPSTLAAGVSEALDKLLLRCLHPRRELRLGSADQVLQELKGMVRLV
jgi:tetratricopeptide (TPR) repeat protein